jgi:DNA mismatch repair ATPase MutS
VGFFLEVPLFCCIFVSELKKKGIELWKKKHPDYIILVRDKDWYHSYNEDAEVISKILNLTVIHNEEVAFPHYKIDTYLPKIIRNGHKVAITDM